jgi:hypothetical protein
VRHCRMRGKAQPGRGRPSRRVERDPAWLAPARCHRLLQRLVAAESISPETPNVKGTNEKTVAWRKLDSNVVECSFHGQSCRDDPHRWLDLYRGSKATDRLGHGVAAVSHFKLIRNQQNHSALLARGPDEAPGLGREHSRESSARGTVAFPSANPWTQLPNQPRGGVRVRARYGSVRPARRTITFRESTRRMREPCSAGWLASSPMSERQGVQGGLVAWDGAGCQRPWAGWRYLVELGSGS